MTTTSSSRDATHGRVLFFLYSVPETRHMHAPFLAYIRAHTAVT